jgi:hypothetical protein
MEPSKPWLEVVRLGQRIVKELGLSDGNSVLGRWMAHRVAELMERTETAATASGREEAAHECQTLIMDLWSQRNNWPMGGPLRKMMPTLERLLGESNHRYHWSNRPDDDSGLIGKLMLLHEREMHFFRLALQAGLDSEASDSGAELLEQHLYDLNDDELQAITFIVRPPLVPGGEAGNDDDELAEEIESEVEDKPTTIAQITEQLFSDFENIKFQRNELISNALSPLNGDGK